MATRIVTRAIILNDEGKVLLGKRSRGHGVSQWALVGGKPDEGETPEETVIREVQEEIGLNFSPTLFKEEVDLTTDPGTEWKVYYFSGNYQGDINLKEDEIAEVVFAGEEDLDTLDITFGHSQILKDYFNSVKI